jgi:PIN domain nuclease of toxin-antitoxin system
MNFDYGKAGMTRFVLDTHVWVWAFEDSPRVSVRARAALETATGTLVSTISAYEIAQKVRLGKWPGMEGFLEALDTSFDAQGSLPIAVDATIALFAGNLDWSHRDPFDRIIAATAMVLDAPLISADAVFDTLPLTRIW